MARIVAAMALTHSPGLTGWFTRAPEAHQRLALGATAEMRRRLEAARPDVLVMFTNDHLLNWPINNIPEYAVGIGDEHIGPADWFDEWLGMEKYRVPGHPALRSEEHTSELQSQSNIVCRLLLEKKKYIVEGLGTDDVYPIFYPY